MILDHVVIAVNELNSAIKDYETLGFNVIQGGYHANRATHNALIIFSDRTYIELLAKTDEEPLSNVVDFSPMLDSGEGLAGFALYCDDIEDEAKRLTDAGFNVGEITIGSREKDGRLIQWKLALIDSGFVPFLIQDITPREWRIPTTDNLITHPNRAVGISAVEIAVRELSTSWETYTKLMHMSPNLYARNHGRVGNIILQESNGFASRFISKHSSGFPQIFNGNISQEEIDSTDLSQEPQSFANMLSIDDKMMANMKKGAERDKEIELALQHKQEALFAIHLIREESDNGEFTREKTHNVNFHQRLGVPYYYGVEILKGLDEVDWSSVKHAYGPATDVPDLLRALTSDNQAVRNNAHHTLNSNITHQGTIYEASIEVIPFLAKLLIAENVDIHAPRDLLSYITFVGVDDPELTDLTRKKLDEIIDLLIENMAHPNAEVRQTIIDQLMLFPDYAEHLTSLLEEQFKSDESILVRAQCLITLSYIWKKVFYKDGEQKLPHEKQEIIAQIKNDNSEPIYLRFEAAMILINDDIDYWLEESLPLFYDIMTVNANEFDGIDHLSLFFKITRVLQKSPDVALQWIHTQVNHPDVRVRQFVSNAIGNLIQAGLPIEQGISLLKTLLNDSNASVRQSTLVIFYQSEYVIEIKDELTYIAEHDPSMMVRKMAQNTLNNLR